MQAILTPKVSLLSIPNLEEETERLTPIQGLMPNPADLPSYCSFYDRFCPVRTDRCKLANPELVEVEPGHYVRCIHAQLKKGCREWH